MFQSSRYIHLGFQEAKCDRHIQESLFISVRFTANFMKGTLEGNAK